MCHSPEYPASEISGRRTHQTAQPLRIRHMKCRFPPHKLVRCQRPKNTDDSRQADHHTFLPHPLPNCHRSRQQRSDSENRRPSSTARSSWGSIPSPETVSQRPGSRDSCSSLSEDGLLRRLTSARRPPIHYQEPGASARIPPTEPKSGCLVFMLHTTHEELCLTQFRDSGFRSRTAERSCCHSR
jgi:hypothetical protein